MRFILIFFTILFFAVNSYANVSSDLHNFFNSLGFSSNATAPNAYQGQQAGYYTGGSIFARDSVRNVQIAQIDLPSYRSGCGGIDLFAGGFSFINSEELVTMMKDILNNAVGYAFTLAMESATPEIANVMKYIQDLANKVNQSNINSCETAAGLVGSIWPQTQESQRKICEDIGTSSSYNLFRDYADARQKCGEGGEMSSTLDVGKNNPKYKDLILDNGNIAWKAINKNGFLQSDTQLAELFMSLSGTIIILKNGNDDNVANTFRVLSSLAADDKVLKALLHGGEAKIYHCDDSHADACLNPTTTTITVSASDSLDEQVKAMLEDIINKIYNDKPLTTEEIGLLQSTRLPVYKMLNVQAAFQQDKSILDITDYSDVIATDILFQYLEESLAVVRTSANILQYPEGIMEEFNKGVEVALNAVRNAERNAYSQMSISVQLIQQTQAIEEMLAGELSVQLMSSIEWARGIQ